MSSDTPGLRVASYLSPPDMHRLDWACRPVYRAFGSPPYLVGSVLTRPDFRDVDLRLILPDDEWDEMFADRPELLLLLNIAISDLILDSSWRTEPYHERDCPACDLADELVGTWAAVFDPLGNWWEVEVPDGLPFVAVTRSPVALAVIVVTHAVIDRYRLARHVVWVKNHLAPAGFTPPWAECKATGYPPDTPVWLAVWLLIIADNTIHLLINAASVAWL